MPKIVYAGSVIIQQQGESSSYEQIKTSCTKNLS